MVAQKGCTEVTRISSYLAQVLPRFLSKSKKFILVDIDEYIVYAPDVGFYECSDMESLKLFIKRLLNSLDVDRVFIAKGVDEKWIEENIRLLIEERKTKNISILTLGKIYNVIHTKQRRLLRRKKVDPEIIAELVELYARTLQ